VVIKERAHKCNPYFDSISIPDLKKQSILSTSLTYRKLGGVGILEVFSAVEVQLAAHALVAFLLPLAS